jgi:serine/threonine-protein kinase
MTDESRVAQILDELFDDQITPEAACRDHPELLEEVRKQWQWMIAVQAKLGARFPSANAYAEMLSQTAPPVAGLPQIVGYKVDGVVAHGGMGVVYRARHLKLNRTVAIKMILGGVSARPQELARFLGEAKAVAGLSHPNIVQVFDAGDVEGQPYFTMEFLEGGNLAQKIAGQPQPARQAAEIVSALAEAMHLAHHNGIIHRDVKPANILLTADGTPKISDFGLARRFETEERLTLTGARIGTLSYMAPEQALGKPALIGPAVDIYSLGAVLYELLTGRPPFRAETSQETERQLLTEEPVSPRRLNSTVPRDLETICLKCLHKNPQRRYESADALAADLRRFLRGEQIMARPASLIVQTGRWIHRHRILVAGLSLGLLVMIAALAGSIRFAAEREATRNAVDGYLREAANFQRQSQFAEARIALERARARLGERDFAHLRAVLEQADRDQAIAARVEKIRSDRASVEGGILRLDRTREEYEAVFRDAELGNRSDDPALVARRIESSNIHAVLVTAVEDWATVTNEPAYLNWLVQVARQAAPDPSGLRERAFTLSVWTKSSELAKLIAAEPVKESSVSVLLTVTERYAFLGGNPVQLLTKCQLIRPHDFWVNFWLAKSLRVRNNPAESIRYYQAALAIRPDSGVVYNHLGLALHDLGRFDDAIDAFQAGLKADPQSNASLGSLGMVLSTRGRHAEAIPKLQAFLRNSPDAGRAYLHLGYSLSATGQREEGLKNLRRGVECDPMFFVNWYQFPILLLRNGIDAKEVRILWRQALASNPPKHNAWDGYAELSLFLGKDDEYRWARCELLKRFGDTSDPHIAERTGRACLFMRGTEEEQKKAAQLIGRAMAADRSKLEPWVPPFFSFADAFLAYRQGRFKESAAILNGDAGRVFGPAPGLVLAMDQFQLEQKNEAQKTLDKALKAFDWQSAKADHREAWMYHILRGEAEAVIKGNSSK